MFFLIEIKKNYNVSVLFINCQNFAIKQQLKNSKAKMSYREIIVRQFENIPWFFSLIAEVCTLCKRALGTIRGQMFFSIGSTNKCQISYYFNFIFFIFHFFFFVNSLKKAKDCKKNVKTNKIIKRHESYFVGSPLVPIRQLYIKNALRWNQP